MTVIRECGSPQGDVIVIQQVCQLMDRCDDHGGEFKDRLLWLEADFVKRSYFRHCY